VERLLAAEADPGCAGARALVPSDLPLEATVLRARVAQWKWLARGLECVVGGAHAEVHASLLARVRCDSECAARAHARRSLHGNAATFLDLFARLPEELRVYVSGFVAASAVQALVAAATAPGYFVV
jgi:hypothetical protein